MVHIVKVSKTVALLSAIFFGMIVFLLHIHIYGYTDFSLSRTSSCTIWSGKMRGKCK